VCVDVYVCECVNVCLCMRVCLQPGRVCVVSRAGHQDVVYEMMPRFRMVGCASIPHADRGVSVYRNFRMTLPKSMNRDTATGTEEGDREKVSEPVFALDGQVERLQAEHRSKNEGEALSAANPFISIIIIIIIIIISYVCVCVCGCVRAHVCVRVRWFVAIRQHFHSVESCSVECLRCRVCVDACRVLPHSSLFAPVLQGTS
jgi:hypothetical protein